MKTAGYIILRFDNKTNEVAGYIENSFSMGFDNNRVRVDRLWEHRWSNDFKNGKKTLRQLATKWCKEQCDKLNAKYGSQYTFKYFRIGSKHCPVHINWSEIVSMKKKERPHDKFRFRNLPFKLK